MRSMPGAQKIQIGRLPPGRDPSTPPSLGPIGAPDPDVMWQWIISQWLRMSNIDEWITGDPSRLDELWAFYESNGGAGIDGGTF